MGPWGGGRRLPHGRLCQVWNTLLNWKKEAIDNSGVQSDIPQYDTCTIVT